MNAPEENSFLAPSSVVVRTPNWLGDLMMATPFLKALLQRFPGVPVDLIVRKGFEEIPLPHRGRVLIYDKRAYGPGAFGRSLRRHGYSHFFVLPPSFSSGWMAKTSGAPWRVGHAGPLIGGDGLRRLLLRPALPVEHPPRSRHLSLEYLDLLAPWGGAGALPQGAALALDEGWVERFMPAALKGRSGYVVLAPGAEYGPAKQWPVAHYAALAKRLEEAGWLVVVAGLPQDGPLAKTILAGLKGLDLTGKTPLNGLLALLARAGLVVSNDSGAMHVAAALGVAQVALFGSTNPVWTAPLNPKAERFYLGVECSPCYRKECPYGHTRCLVELSPEPVALRALELLALRGQERL